MPFNFKRYLIMSSGINVVGNLACLKSGNHAYIKQAQFTLVTFTTIWSRYNLEVFLRISSEEISRLLRQVKLPLISITSSQKKSFGSISKLWIRHLNMFWKFFELFPSVVKCRINLNFWTERNNESKEWKLTAQQKLLRHSLA